MSWVVTRALCKSGGNDIRWRIGQYNKFSSLKMLHCKKLSTALMHSPYCMEVQQKLKRSRKENILHNMYSSMDQYVSHKLLNPSDPKTNHSRQNLWMKTYAREIMNRMNKTFTWACSIALLTKKFRRRAAHRRMEKHCKNRITLDTPIAWGVRSKWDHSTRSYIQDVKKIIEENKKYYSMTVNAPLPAKWTEYMDDEGDMGYYNLDTQEITYSSAFILIEEIKKINPQFDRPRELRQVSSPLRRLPHTQGGTQRSR